MATVDELVIKVFFDDKQLKSSADKNEKVINDFAKNIETKLSRAANTLVGAFGLDFAKNLADRFITAGSRLNVLSNNLQTSAKDLYTWQQVMIRAGGTAEDYTSAITTLYSKLNDAQLTKNPELLNILQNVLGVSPFENGKRKDIIKLTQETINSLYKLPLNVAQPLADRLGIGNLSKLMAQFKNPQELENAIRHIQKLGVVTDDQALKLQNANNKLNDLKQTFDIVGNQLIVDIIPEIDNLTGGLTAFGNYLQNNEDDVKNFFNSLVIAAGLMIAANPFTAWLAGLTGLVYFMPKLLNYLNEIPRAKDGQISKAEQSYNDRLRGVMTKYGTQKNSDFSSIIEQIAPGIKQIESSGGKQTNTGNGAYGDYQIRPNWGNKARAKEGLPAQSAEWYLNPKNNYDTYKLMMMQNLQEHHGNIDAAIREYSGGSYGYDAVKGLGNKIVPSSANIQNTGQQRNISNTQTSFNINNLNLPGIANQQQFVDQMSQSTKTGYAFSSGILA